MFVYTTGKPSDIERVLAKGLFLFYDGSVDLGLWCMYITYRCCHSVKRVQVPPGPH